MADKSIMTVREVAAYLQIGFRSVYRLAQQGDLPGRKVLGKWRFHVKDIDAWVRDVEARAAQRPAGAGPSEPTSTMDVNETDERAE